MDDPFHIHIFAHSGCWCGAKLCSYTGFDEARRVRDEEKREMQIFQNCGEPAVTDTDRCARHQRSKYYRDFD